MPMVKTQAHTTPNASASAARVSNRLRLVLATSSISRAVASMLARWCCSMSLTTFRYFVEPGTKMFWKACSASASCPSAFSFDTCARESRYTLRCSLTRRNNSFSSGLEMSASIFFCSSPDTTDDCLASSAK
ncbi:hypothetical protein D3C81_1461630 [compost metagenome]